MRVRPSAPWLLLMVVIGVAPSAFAQLELEAEIRPRTEFRNGFKTLLDKGEDPALFTEQRSRLGLYFGKNGLELKFTGQDVRLWGQTGQISKSDALSSVYEAWGRIALSDKWALQVGRQELVYDDQRIFGSLNWAAQGRSHDAARIQFADSAFKAHGILAFNQDGSIPEPAKVSGTVYQSPKGFTQVGGGLPNYKSLQALWAQQKWAGGQVSGLALHTSWQTADSSEVNRYTLGLNARQNLLKSLTWVGAYYHQLGKDLAKRRVNAYLLSNQLQLRPRSGLQLILGNDWISGSRPNSTGSSTFDPLFGTHHKFYGLMDYFYVGNPHAQAGRTVGLIDTYLKVNRVWSKKLRNQLQVHHFRSPVAISAAAEGDSDPSEHLGWEIDLVLHFIPRNGLKVSGGYSQMIGSDSLELLKGGDQQRLQNWAWIMLSYQITSLKLI